MKLIHFSDFHVWRASGWDGDVGIKRVLGRVNLVLGRTRAFPPAWGRKVIEAILERDVDAVVFSGDLTTAALLSEFEGGRALFDPLREKWGERFVMIPGNHDRYTRRSTTGRLFERHALGRELGYPFNIDLAKGVGVVGLDLSGPRPLTSRGVLSPESIARAAEAVAVQRARTPFVIVVGHYPLAYPAGVRVSWQHALPLRERLARALVSAGAGLYLHGHKHRRWALRVRCENECLKIEPWRSREADPSAMVCINPGSSGFRSADRERAAGFVELTLEGSRVTGVEATVVRDSAGGELETERLSLDSACAARPGEEGGLL